MWLRCKKISKSENYWLKGAESEKSNMGSRISWDGSNSNVAILFAIIKNSYAFTGMFKVNKGKYDVICNVFIILSSSVKDFVLY